MSTTFYNVQLRPNSLDCLATMPQSYLLLRAKNVSQIVLSQVVYMNNSFQNRYSRSLHFIEHALWGENGRGSKAN